LCLILDILEWLVWIMMDCTTADTTGMVVSTAPIGAGRPPGSGPLGRAVRNYGPHITKAWDVSGSGADCG
jgi:hypothetical protein